MWQAENVVGKRHAWHQPAVAVRVAARDTFLISALVRSRSRPIAQVHRNQTCSGGVKIRHVLALRGSNASRDYQSFTKLTTCMLHQYRVARSRIY